MIIFFLFDKIQAGTILEFTMRTEKKLIAYNKEMELINKLKKERDLLIPLRAKTIPLFLLLGLNIVSAILCFGMNIQYTKIFYLLFNIFSAISIALPLYYHSEEMERRDDNSRSSKLMISSFFEICAFSFMFIFISYGLTIAYSEMFYSKIDLDTIALTVSGILSLISFLRLFIYIKKTTGKTDINNKKKIIKSNSKKIQELKTNIYQDLDTIDKAKLQSFEIKELKLTYSNLLLSALLEQRLKDAGYSNYEDYEAEMLSRKIRENNSESIHLYNI